VAVNPADPLAQLDLSFDLSVMGTLYFKPNNFKEGAEQLPPHLEIRRALVDADPPRCAAAADGWHTVSACGRGARFDGSHAQPSIISKDG